MILHSGQQIGPYRVTRLLGAGAMGEVYEAMHERISRQVAIKVLHPDLASSPEVAGRFLNEARAVNIVRHLGLVQISDYGQLPNGTTYIVMEYLAGETLGKYLERHGSSIPQQVVLNFAQQIALALAAAHDKQIVHRDLKPDNVMLVEEASFPGRLRVKLLDFGIAKVGRENQAAEVDEVKTQIGSFLGSPMYMSPEQCRGAEKVTPASDVYSFGVMLYHLLSGAPPFSGGGVAGICGMHLFQAPVPLLQKAPQVFAPLAALVDSMLQKAPEQRPTMPEIASQLQRHQLTVRGRAGSGLTFQRRLVIGIASALISLGALWVVLSTSGLTVRRPTVTRRCNAAGFCAEPLPAEVSRLRSLAVFSDHDVWACGDPGVLLHYTGAAWQLVRSGMGHRLYQVFGLSASDIWAVGDNGTLLHFDGKSWTQVPEVSTAILTGIWGARPNDLWIIGKANAGQGTLLHYDGTIFQSQAIGTTQTLLAIWGTSASSIWVVGSQGTMLHYNGAAWRVVPNLGTSEKLTGVFGSSDRDVWAVGHSGVALHFDGHAWTLLPTGHTTNLTAGFSTGPRDAWLVGGRGMVMHYDGSRLVPEDSGVTADLDGSVGLVGAGGTELWAVGAPAMLLHRLR